jgi:iron complex transport system substrate-binding protein
MMAQRRRRLVQAVAGPRLGMGMGLVALAGAALLAPQPAFARPLRVMSLNECADQLVMMLLPPAQIASVTWLSRDAETSQMWRTARRIPANHGLGEDVVRDQPDLVVAGSYTTPATRSLLKSLHYRLLVLPPAESFDDIRRTTMQVADAVGEPARGRALIAHLDQTLKALATDKGPPLRVAAWDSAGFSATPGSLYDTILRAAGANNVAASRTGLGASAPEVERLLALAPDVLVAGAPAFQRPGRHGELALHPLVRRYWSDRTVIAPLTAYTCGTPFSADAALSLRQQMRTIATKARTRLPYRADWQR